VEEAQVIFKLSNLTAKHAAIDAIMAVPEGWVVRITDATRSLDQNALLHAVLTDVANQLEWAGERQDVETWKRLLVAAWMRATGRGVRLLPAIDGQGFDALYQRTSHLSKAECSELVEYIYAWATDKDVIWTAAEREPA
jgi:hypothetical protein